MTIKEALVGMAVERFGDEAGKSSSIGSIAFIRECIDRLRGELSKEDGLLDEVSANPEDFTYDTPSEVRSDYWANLATWSPIEAAKLAIGRDPDDRSIVTAIERKRIRDFRRATSRLYSINQSASSLDIFVHLEELGADFPDAISVIINKKLRTHPDYKYKRWYKSLKNKQIKNAEHKATLLKMIYALGNAAYGFTPDKNNEAASRISTKTKLAGVYVSEVTIRKQLNAAHEYRWRHGESPSS